MASLFMIVGALLEFAIVLILNYHPRKVEVQPENNAEEEGPSNTNRGNILGCRMSHQATHNNEAWAANNPPKKSTHETIDHVCFRMFPITYVLFNAIYLAYYGLK